MILMTNEKPKGICFTTIDGYFGRKVTLTEKVRQEHIVPYHPKEADMLDEIKNTVEDSDVIIKTSGTEDRYVYRKWLSKSDKAYLQVPVHFDKVGEEIRSAYEKHGDITYNKYDEIVYMKEAQNDTDSQDND